MNKKDSMIVAIDVPTVGEAITLIDTLADTVNVFKVGSQIFTVNGPEICRHVNSKGKKVFLDLKFHDIPNTVASAVTSAVSLNVFMLTIHTCGGSEMMEAAAKAAKTAAAAQGVTRPIIVGVTVLTSQAHEANLSQTVLERARAAKAAGLDGVVASVEEAAMIRRELGPDFVIVTPGIRPAGADVGDQKRVATPKTAIESGSNFLVVGRPIVADKDPKQAALNILKEIGA